MLSGRDISYEVGGFREIMMPLIEKLSISKEQEILIYISLFNTCFATPLMMKCQNFGTLKERYFQQVDMIFKEYK